MTNKRMQLKVPLFPSPQHKNSVYCTHFALTSHTRTYVELDWTVVTLTHSPTNHLVTAAFVCDKTRQGKAMEFLIFQVILSQITYSFCAVIIEILSLGTERVRSGRHMTFPQNFRHTQVPLVVIKILIPFFGTCLLAGCKIGTALIRKWDGINLRNVRCPS